MRFEDRMQAGELLAEKLLAYRDDAKVVVLALPRGGVEVAAPVANILHAQLDVILVRKIGHPEQPELAIGAICETGNSFFARDIMVDVSWNQVEQIIDAERKVIVERKQLYRSGTSLPVLKDKLVIIVDDGMATGATMKVAVQAIQKECPERIVLAVPVASRQALRSISEMVDECVVLYVPDDFFAVGQFYTYFPQTTDERVKQLLQQKAY